MMLGNLGHFQLEFMAKNRGQPIPWKWKDGCCDPVKNSLAEDFSWIFLMFVGDGSRSKTQSCAGFLGFFPTVKGLWRDHT